MDKTIHNHFKTVSLFLIITICVGTISDTSFANTKVSEKEINIYVKDICKEYSIEPELVMSMIYYESSYNPTAKTGDCIGLMQISKRWHKERAKKLGVENIYEPRDNILLGVDYLSELFTKYKDPKLVLMMYNMNHKTAIRLYKQGKTTKYAKRVLARTKKLKKGE